MIELLKGAISKNRKARSKSTPRSARVTPNATPTTTPRTDNNSNAPRCNSFENRSVTPQSSIRTVNSPRSLSVNYRKTIRDKVDKKIKDRFINDSRFLFANTDAVFKDTLSEELSLKTDELKVGINDLIESKIKDISFKLKDYMKKSTETIKKIPAVMGGTKPQPQTLSPRIEKASRSYIELRDSRDLKDSKEYSTFPSAREEKSGGLIELMLDNYSTIQNKVSDNIEKNIEGLAIKEIDKIFQPIKNEIMKGIQISLDAMYAKTQTFCKNGIRVMVTSPIRSERVVKGQPKASLSVQSARSSKSVPKSQQGPQVDVSMTLQEYLKAAEDSKKINIYN